jgi:DNA-binding Lrp family transcriptional regulator
MLSAFVFLNCDIRTEPAIVNEISDIDDVSEAVQVSGVYDTVVAKVSEEPMEDVANSVKKIRAISNIRSNLTMIVSEEHAMKHMEVAR